MSAHIDTLSRYTTCRLEGVDDEWPIDDLDCAGELREAIARVHDDHDFEARLKSEIWVLEVKWNDDRNEPVVGVFGYHGEFGVEMEDSR